MLIELLFILLLVNLSITAIYINVQLLSKFKNIHKLNNFIYNISGETLSSDNIEDIYFFILKELLKIIKKSSKASFLVYNEYDDIMEYKAVIGYDFKQIKDMSFKIKDLYHYEKFKNPCIIHNQKHCKDVYLNFNRYNELINIDSLDIKSTLCIPIHIDTKFSGIINIHLSEPYNTFSKYDLKIAKFIKSQMDRSLKFINLLYELNNNAHYDYLTKTMNIKYFESKFNKIHLNSKCVLILIDLNNFKYINDNFGHHQGNNILKIFSDTVRTFIRKDDLFARCGGDEFLILLKDIDLNIAQIRIAQIRESLKDIISFGVGMQEIIFNENTSLHDIFKLIDKKMYEDKKNKPKY
ncbi:GGDEF domain-containing protein [Tepidibacter hydrothermalis]|uniref:Sensor domain-containing diguanylate cyclase n=1 Tax=Tepidibacter hydrothermalis TaxID=3036126 RepID=A0ABY8EB44_9FIRM|nr:sensor domain-containing diguanylate cyclase [Tepidibacter hydrothermalis]WFD10143.1 sensor domain-containing diguanylate cyclase [Tepidibacter hydrothermalis]